MFDEQVQNNYKQTACCKEQTAQVQKKSPNNVVFENELGTSCKTIAFVTES